MSPLLFTVLAIGIIAVAAIFIHAKKGEKRYNRSERRVGKTRATTRSSNQKKNKMQQSTAANPSSPFDGEAIRWCASFVGVSEADLRSILANIPACYSRFKIRKRSGGYRTISAPQQKLLALQRTIYMRSLLPVPLHPAATGFRKNISIVHNAKLHLGKSHILKADIHDFFGSIDISAVECAFEKIGYPAKFCKVLAQLCCLNSCLPQGAPTSPALSNIIAYEMDKQLNDLALSNSLSYSRYADDLCFSGNAIPDSLLAKVEDIAKEHGLLLNRKKTQLLAKGRRKIITGISISSEHKLTIPKKKKRELRQSIHYMLTRGVDAHKKHIGSTDPAYLKRTIGYLSFWLSVEPQNQYVVSSLKALKRLAASAQQ